MSDTPATEETVYSFPMDQNRVDVLHLRYSGGGECYEFRVFQNGAPVHTSENRYETPGSAANDGSKWVAYNL
jgi:hypothetical protein